MINESLGAVAPVELGKQLLSGSAGQFAPQQGAELILSAAANGDAQASAMAAVLAGAGVCQPQNWTLALDHLQCSAEAGWPPAQRQLQLLAAEIAPADAKAAHRNWAHLRRTIDLDTWLRVPAKESLSESPRIRRIRSFLSPPLCQWLIDCARDRLVRSRIYDAVTGGGALQDARTNTETDFNIVETDIILLLVRARIAQATGLPPAVMELTKVLHYAVGERFAPHFDFIEPSSPAMAQELAVRGQRLATFLIYLNDDYEGGETDFPELSLRNRGSQGDALLFANIAAHGEPDRRTLHAGLPPTRGEKWLLSQWIRDRTPSDR